MRLRPQPNLRCIDMARPFLTPWFDTHIKPTREGPYQTVTDGIEGWSYWLGDVWGSQRASREEAVRDKNQFAGEQNKRWRAHAKPYKGYEE